MGEPGLLEKYKNGTAPWWMGAVERLGLPTVLLFAMMAFGWHVYKDVKIEWRTANTSVVEVLQEFVTEQRATNEKLDDLLDSHR